MRSIRPFREQLVATYSLVAHDPAAGEWGVVVQSKFLAVGAYVPFARAGVGAIATQSWCNTTYGPRGLALLEAGADAQEALDALVAADEDRDLRQVGVVDAAGGSATFTGARCFEWAGGLTGPGYAAQGNILVSGATVEALAGTYEAAQGCLADRLIAALRAAQAAGGDSRGKQSAALLVVREAGGYGGFSDRVYDLRVDDHPEPIEELDRLLGLHRLYFGTTAPGRLASLEGPLLAEVRGHLARLGYLDPTSGYDAIGGSPGGVDVPLDEATTQALTRYHLTENFDDRVHAEAIDLDVLDYLRAQG